MHCYYYDFKWNPFDHELSFHYFIIFTHSVKYSSRLKYQDLKSNIGWYEHQYTVDLSPICKEDLVLLPRGSARDISMPLMICNKITSSLNFIHPATAKVGKWKVDNWLIK